MANNQHFCTTNCVPGSVLCILYIYGHIQSSQQLNKVAPITILTLQMRKLRYKEIM